MNPRFVPYHRRNRPQNFAHDVIIPGNGGIKFEVEGAVSPDAVGSFVEGENGDSFV